MGSELGSAMKTAVSKMVLEVQWVQKGSGQHHLSLSFPRSAKQELSLQNREMNATHQQAQGSRSELLQP